MMHAIADSCFASWYEISLENHSDTLDPREGDCESWFLEFTFFFLPF